VAVAVKARMGKAWTLAIAALVAMPLALPATAQAYPAGATFTISGHGRAHGVGLCMGGAILRATPVSQGGAGQSYATILKYYYHGATVAGSSKIPSTLRVGLGDYGRATITGSFRIPGESGTFKKAVFTRSGGTGTFTNGGTKKLAAVSCQMVPTGGWGALLNVAEVTNSDMGSGGYTHYRGRILIVRGSSNVTVVNIVRMEDYVKGIGEEPEDRPQQFLNVTAVVARTYATYRKLHPKYGTSVPYDLVHTSDSQVYAGYDYEKKSPKLTAAVNATRHLVVLYKAAPILAAYFSNCGGHTESAKVAWGSTGSYPYLTGLYCNEKNHALPYCRKYHGYSWTPRFTFGAFAKKLGVKGEIVGFSGWLHGYNIQPRAAGALGLGGSDRIYRARILTKPSGYSKTVTGYTIQNAMALQNNQFIFLLPPTISGLTAKNVGDKLVIGCTIGARGWVSATLYNSKGVKIWAGLRYLKNKGAVTLSRPALTPGAYSVRLETRDVVVTKAKPLVGPDMNYSTLKFTAKASAPTLTLSRSLFGPTPGSAVPTIAATIRLSVSAACRLVVKDGSGVVRKTLLPLTTLAAGAHPYVWDGTPDGSITPLPSGRYTVELTAGTAIVSAAVDVDSVRPTVTGLAALPATFFPGAPVPPQTTVITFTSSESGTVSIICHAGSAAGAAFRTMTSAMPAAGLQGLTWDGLGDAGAAAVPGLYRIEAQVTDVAGNRSVNDTASFPVVETK
jgi:peptidoglycan hydrolase-like amidase